MVKHTRDTITTLSAEERRALLAQLLEQKHKKPKLAPLSFAQQRLWFLHQFDPHSSLYNVPVALRINGQLNDVVLHQALQEIVQRHDVLRTRLRNEGGQPLQEIAPTGEALLPIIDLRFLEPHQRDIAVKEYILIWGRISGWSGDWPRSVSASVAC